MKNLSGYVAYVESLPTCDVCEHEEGTPGVEARYDGKTRFGPWANMCERHFKSHGVGVGLGRGQELVVQATGKGG